MSRILWMSNAPWAGSGYGEQTATFVPRIGALGHDMAVFCNYGVNEATIPWEGIPVYPSDSAYGNEAIATWKEHHAADLIITLADSFVMHPDEWPDDVTMAIWAPIDHYPIPAPVLAVLSHKKVRPIAMSQFGYKLMEAANLDPLYVPHGIDTDLFKPRSEIRDTVRDKLGVPREAFLAGMVAANKSHAPSRKSFDTVLFAFADFCQEHDDAYLYIHSQRNGLAKGMGEDLELIVSAVEIERGVKFGHRVIFPERKIWDIGIPASALASIYQGFDVLLNPSMGEGFGVPIVEAQASGVPVITSNHSAMRELTHAGWIVDGDPYWDKMAASFFIRPYIAGITAALEQAYDARDDDQLRAGAREFALGYDADLVTVNYWEPALTELLGESRQVRRARERRQAKRQRVAA